MIENLPKGVYGSNVAVEIFIAPFWEVICIQYTETLFQLLRSRLIGGGERNAVVTLYNNYWFWV